MTDTSTKFRFSGRSLLCTALICTGTALMIAACSSVAPPPRPFSQDTLPVVISVPAGHTVVLETTATGVLNYECRASATGPHAWTLMSPQAYLLDRNGKDVVAYSGPPAKWTHIDGSSVVGTQLAVSPNGEFALPLQLARAEPSLGSGALQNVSFIQRIKTKGGVEKTRPCGAVNTGEKLTLPYQADYIFWRPV